MRSPGVIRLPVSIILRLRLGGAPVWAVLLGVYLLSRILSTVLLAASFAVFAGSPIAHFDGGSTPLGFLHSWDGRFYSRIATDGYPTVLPLDSAGEITKNQWAFLPLYPSVVHAVSLLGTTVQVAAIFVSAVFGYGATLALHRLLIRRVGATSAFWGAVFFCFGPMSFLLQLGYAESLFLFLMFASLAALRSRRYGLMIPFAGAAAFTHPGALALAAALAIHYVIRRRDPLLFAMRERMHALGCLAIITFAGIAWPLVASLATGNPSAYFDTELAWWRDYIGDITFVPFTPSFIFALHFLGAIGVIVVVAAVLAFFWLLTRPSARVLGPDILAYSASYFVYLLAVFLPQQSLFRMLLPLSPLLGVPALSRTPRRRRVTLGVSIGLQSLSVLLFWVVWPP